MKLFKSPLVKMLTSLETMLMLVCFTCIVSAILAGCSTIKKEVDKHDVDITVDGNTTTNVIQKLEDIKL